ncbi:MAG: hypothetical protein ACE5EQ_12580 [Phycisphaerae bacterium]
MNTRFIILAVSVIGLVLLESCTDSPSTAKPSNSKALPVTIKPTDTRTDNPDTPKDRFGSAVVQGVVRYSGPRPKPRPLPMRGDKACHTNGQTVLSQATTLSKSGGVPYVFVFVKNGIDGIYSPPKVPVNLNQKGCLFVPHVFGLQTGQTLRITNSDETLHNIHALARRNEAFNLSQPDKGAMAVKQFKRTEVMIKFKCDVHGWMDAYCGVLPHPFFAVTDENGMFEIPRLPAGNYVLEARHELWGILHKTLTLQDGETRQTEWIYSHPSKTAAAPARNVIIPSTRGDES